MPSIISIVTPSLNQGRFIEETINSVLSQRGGFYLDYIIVDGGSSDNSLKVIKKYDSLLKERRFVVRCKGIGYRWISKTDKGQVDAVSKGFKLARGDILAWLNSDDVYTEGALSAVFQEFTLHPENFVIFGNAEHINEKGESICEEKGFYSGIEHLLEECWNTTSNCILQPEVFFRKECIAECGLPDTNLRFTFDYDLFIRFSLKYQFHHIDRTLAKFRYHSKSKTGYLDARYIAERVEVSRRYWEELSKEKQERIKIDSTRYLIRRLFSRAKFAYKSGDFSQFIKCCLYLFKGLILVFSDKVLVLRALSSFIKYRWNCFK